jgi:hypothetical protein
MNNGHDGRLGRRGILGLGAAALASGSLASLAPLGRARADGAPGGAAQLPQRLLFVVAATGGASILDAFLPVARAEVSTTAKADTLLTYDDAALDQASGSAFRTVRRLDRASPFKADYELRSFLRAHGDDTAVLTQETTSVNHVVAQKRAVTGAGINGGRTIMELAAQSHGKGLLLPNVNFAGGAYVEPGDDKTVPAEALGQVVTNPLYFALATDARRGVKDAPGEGAFAAAREARARLDAASAFGKRYAGAPRLRRYEDLRANETPKLEGANLIARLMLLADSPENPLSAYELESSPDAALVLRYLPDLNKGDRMQAQAAIAFLLALYGLSASLTIGFAQTSVVAGHIADTPLGFDFSHTDHVTGQNVMWARTMKVTDGLISLLKATGLWSRSVVYIATDFGRTKSRPAGADKFGTGHEQSNGNVIVSPLVKGNRVFGGVDPETCRTYGFDGRTGEPVKGTVMREGHVYSALAHLLGVDFPGRKDLSGVVR